MPKSAPRNELELIDLREWGRIFGPEQLVQIHESSLHQPDGAVRDRVAGHAGEPRGARRSADPCQKARQRKSRCAAA